MPLWLYHLPVWQFGSLLLAGWIIPALASFELVHRLWKPRFDDTDKGLALTLLALVATLNSLLLAFCAVSVWESFRSADSAVSNEAVTLSALSRDLAVMGTPPALEARERVRAYTRSILDEEWQDMQGTPGGTGIAGGGLHVNRIFRAVQRIEPGTAAQQALLHEIWARANEMLKFRRERVSASESTVPASLWFVVIAGGVMSLIPLLVLPATAFNRAAVIFLSFSTGLVFFFIAQMDRPFVGDLSISPRPYERTLSGMESWDQGPR